MSAALDPSRLGELRDLGGDEFVLDLLQLYLAEAEAAVTELQALASSADGHQIDRAAHKLKGMSSQIGGLRLAELCKQVMLHALDRPAPGGGTRPADLARVRELLPALLTEARRVELAVRSLISATA